MSRSSLAVLALATIVASCKDGTSEAGAASGFCTEMFGALDRRRAACESWSAAYLGLRITEIEATCDEVSASVALGRERFDSTHARLCLSSWRAALAAVPCSAPEPPPPAACDEVLQPAVPLDGECVYDADCIGGWCSGVVGTCSRTCVPLGGEGASCSSIRIWPSHGPCAPGLSCEFSCDRDGFACVVPPAAAGAGSRCGLCVAWCGAGLFCDPSGGMSNAACGTVLGIGEPCPVSSACAVGLTCGAQRVCARYVGEGAGCTDPTTECGAGLFCDGGVCHGLPDLGVSCAASRSCLRGYCSSSDSTCQPRKAGGEPCAANDECAWYACIGGSCAAPLCP